MFRIEKFNNKNINEIQVKFSEPIHPDTTISQIRVKSSIKSIADLAVGSIELSGDVITIFTKPQASLALYFVEFDSLRSSNNNQLNGVNRIFFVGQERANPIRDSLLETTPSVYEVESNTFVRQYFSVLSEVLLKLQSQTFEIGNANYIDVEVSPTITNRGDLSEEIVTRGFGPNDRLNNEGVFEVMAVRNLPNGALTKGQKKYNQAKANLVAGSDISNVNLSFYRFPSEPISLQAVETSEIVSNEERISNNFNGLLLTLSKSNVSILNYLVKNQVEEYPVNVYGYAVNNNRYDSVFGRSLLTLENNQIKLSDSSVLLGGFALPVGDDELEVFYTYIDKGIQVDRDSIEVFNVQQSVREFTPPLTTSFNLKKGFITNLSGEAITSGGVQFLNPQPVSGLPYQSIHPAFTTEIVFDLNRLPSAPGEYTINYQSGQVVIFGSFLGPGTGSTSPVATYFYKNVFKQGIDYSISPDVTEIVATPGSSLANSSAKINYRYQKIYVEGVDYLNESHVEVINEDVESQISLTEQSIGTNFGPITNVFEIRNETTGERYGVTRFDNNKVYFNTRQPLEEKTRTFEPVNFRTQFAEMLLIEETLSDDSTEKVLKISLEFDGILAHNAALIGSNVNTSVLLSRADLFIEEYFYDSLQSLAVNLNKLTSIGDYIINYSEGIIYVLTASSQTSDLGSISYKHRIAEPNNKYLLEISKIFYKKNVNDSEEIRVDYLDYDASSFTPRDLLGSVEKSLFSQSSFPVVLGTTQTGTEGQYFVTSYEFIALDGNFDASVVGYILRLEGEPDRTVVSVLSSNRLLVDIPFTDQKFNQTWALIDFSLSDGYNLNVSNNIGHIQGIYLLSELQTLPYSSLTNYYNSSVDTFSQRKITLNNALISSVPAGTAFAVAYSPGTLFVNYKYLDNVIRVSYEYGDNSLNWAISDAIEPGQNYYVSYRYGALRQKLLENFGILTQIEELLNPGLEFDRELYRSFVSGTLASFLQGPTINSFKSLVEKVVGIEPTVRDLTFYEWTPNRDHLYRSPPQIIGTPEFSTGKFGDGLVFKDGFSFKLNAEPYISYREGTFEGWVQPFWDGIDNDATITVSSEDILPEQIFIGPSAVNPASLPFSISKNNDDIQGQPINYLDEAGLYIWHDPDTNLWNFVNNLDIEYTLTTSGSFYNLSDGYLTYSSNSIIRLDGYDDGRLGAVSGDGYESLFNISFSSDNLHYIFDSGLSLNKGRISLYKDGSGYLNFAIAEERGSGNRVQNYAVSCNIQDWIKYENYFVSCSWRVNTPEAIDEMHLFVNGKEVSNAVKYGSSTPLTSDSVIRQVAEETIILSSTENTVGAADGVTQSGSNLLTSASSDFINDGIMVGDTVFILGSTPDSANSPYTITGISPTEIQLDQNLLLSLTGVEFTINPQTYPISTNIDLERFAVFKDDGYGPSEMNGQNSLFPDFYIEQEEGVNSITLINNVFVGDRVYLNTLGLTHGICNDTIHCYADGYDVLSSRLPPPASLTNFDLYKVIFPSFSLEDGYILNETDSASFTGNTLNGTITLMNQPSNAVTGKAIKVRLGGFDNIDFTGTNEVIIDGEDSGGATSETLTFTNYEELISSTLFISINFISFTFEGNDPTDSLGSLYIEEGYSLTKSENNGDYAQLAHYDNGHFEFVIFGSGGTPFNFESGQYRFHYPISLNIRMKQKGDLYIGSDIQGKNSFNGIIDEVVILSEMLTDLRPGDVANDARTVTEDYFYPVPLPETSQTLLLLPLNKEIVDKSISYRPYSETYYSSNNSVNPSFGESLVVLGKEDVFKIDNASGVFRTEEGSVEFWLSPLIDTAYDLNKIRYYMDLSVIKSKKLLSTSATRITLEEKAKKIISIRMLDGSVEYSENSTLLPNGKDIILSTPLPGNISNVIVEYLPSNFAGDRISIYKTDNNLINFTIVAGFNEYTISYPIRWKRNTWHRVKATWRTNSLSSNDQMRLFIDGVESGIVLWGSPGLVYGTGVLYGSASVGSAGHNTLTANIKTNDFFSDIFIGNSYNLKNSSMAKFDNLRFSNIVREPQLVGTSALDLNYSANWNSVFPVVEDIYTTGLYNFNKELVLEPFFSNLYSKFTPLFRIEVDINDGFKQIDDVAYRNLLDKILNRVRPAHTSMSIKYLN